MTRKIFTSCLIFIVLFIGAWLINGNGERHINDPLLYPEQNFKTLPISNLNNGVNEDKTRPFGPSEYFNTNPFGPREYIRIKPIDKEGG